MRETDGHRRRRRSSSKWVKLGQFVTVVSIQLVLAFRFYSHVQHQSFYPSNNDIESSGASGGKLGDKNPFREDPPESYGACKSIDWQHFSKRNHLHFHSHKPIWVASYPGSGAELFRTLIEAITGGIPGWSIYDADQTMGDGTTKSVGDCLQVHAATCKTHWPILEHYNPHNNSQSYHSQSILLLRNPRKAFPSRLNHLWEMNNHQGYHSQQAPERAWDRWRNKSLLTQLQKYQEFLRSWVTKETIFPVAFILPYEELIDPIKGPQWTQTELASVLKAAGIPRIAATDDLGCLWKHVVVDKPQMRRGNHSYTPGYTERQHEKMLEVLDTMIDEFNKHPQLVSILESYRDDIATNSRIVAAPT